MWNENTFYAWHLYVFKYSITHSFTTTVSISAHCTPLCEVRIYVAESLNDLEQLPSSTDNSNIDRSLPSLNLPALVCREDFFERNFTCLPRCAVWEQYSHLAHVVLDVIWAFTSVTMPLASTTIIGIFTIRRKTV